MHHTGPLPLTFKGPEQGIGGKNCQIRVGENPEIHFFLNTTYVR